MGNQWKDGTQRGVARVGSEVMEMDLWYGLLIEEMADLEDERRPCAQDGSDEGERALRASKRDWLETGRSE
jgi:hypothetical protein